VLEGQRYGYFFFLLFVFSLTYLCAGNAEVALICICGDIYERAGEQLREEIEDYISSLEDPLQTFGEDFNLPDSWHDLRS
jgi:hypothetical protein